ncbi:MAG: amidase [Gammaproteobacteria bacterium]|jgi:amidase
MRELYQLTATQAVALLRSTDIQSLELVEEAIARIEKVDGAVNARPERYVDRARTLAQGLPGALPGAHASPNEHSLLGLPIAVKDHDDVGGVRTAYGLPISQATSPVIHTQRCPGWSSTVQ